MTDPDLKDAALRLLGRREHSRLELRRKLGRRDVTRAAIELVLDELAERELQSDERFARDYARSRVRRGYGPIRIRADLRSRGVEAGLGDRIVDALELDGEPVDWAAVARATCERRFGELSPGDTKERARRWRSLARRGFSAGQISSALEGGSDGRL